MQEVELWEFLLKGSWIQEFKNSNPHYKKIINDWQTTLFETPFKKKHFKNFSSLL